MSNLRPCYLAALLLLAGFSIFGSFGYWLWGFTSLSVWLTLVLTLVGLIFVRKYLPKPKLAFRLSPLHLAYIFFYLVALVWLSQAGTNLAINSPWQVVSSNWLVVYCLLTIILIYSLYQRLPGSLFLISLHYFLSLSVALLVYHIGYGFDPFVHQAAVHYIDAHGAVEPKTLYYAGQYALELMVHRLSGLSLITIDKFLLPFLAALFWPSAIYHSQRQAGTKSVALLTVLASLLLPASFFIATTPQGLAYFWLLLIVALGLSAKSSFDFICLAIFSLAALITQPIAGLPAVFLVTALYLVRAKSSWRSLGLGLVALANALCLPAIFWYLNLKQGLANPVNQKMLEVGNQSLISFPNLHNLWLNFVQLLDNNYWLLLSALIIAGLYLVGHSLLINKQRLGQSVYFVYALLALSGLIAFGLSSRLPFEFLINYDRSHYTQRLLYSVGLLCLPFIWTSLGWFFSRLVKQKLSLKLPLFFFLAISLTAAVYLYYPRYDDYLKTRGPATSQVDLQAVDWIAADAGSQDYIVLANQQVGAAALHQLGFKKYYQGQLYYSIPTGAPLYQYYLDMTTKPSLAVIDQARQLTNVPLVYLVVNSYWEPFVKITANNQALASSWYNLDNALYIFKFAPVGN